MHKVGRVTRAICIMSHPIPDTNESHSVQVILPQKQLGRKSDMYVIFTNSVPVNFLQFIDFVCANWKIKAVFGGLSHE